MSACEPVQISSAVHWGGCMFGMIYNDCQGMLPSCAVLAWCMSLVVRPPGSAIGVFRARGSMLAALDTVACFCSITVAIIQAAISHGLVYFATSGSAPCDRMDTEPLLRWRSAPFRMRLQVCFRADVQGKPTIACQAGSQKKPPGVAWCCVIAEDFRYCAETHVWRSAFGSQTLRMRF